MEQTKIKINVSQKSAIAAGRTSYGDQIVTLSDADVAALTPEEREEILHLETGYASQGEDGVRLSRTTIDSDGLAGVREALQFRRAKRLEKDAEESAERESFTERDLATIAKQATNTTYGSSENHWWQHPELDTPTLAVRRVEIQKYLEEQRAEKERVKVAEKAEARAQIDALMARLDTATLGDLSDVRYGSELHAYTLGDEAALIQRRIAALESEEKVRVEAETAAILQRYRDYALTGAAGEAAKLAAAQGYDVRRAVMDAIEASLPETDRTDSVRTEYSWEERSSPSLEALRLHQTVTEAIAAVRTTIPDWIEIEVSRVQRITEPAPDTDGDEEPGEATHYTGVVVTIRAPKVSTRYRFYYSE
jgi:hypothetical protein